MDRNEFIKIMKENHDDLEKFSMIKDELLHNGKSRFYKRNCLLCKKDTHFERNCNYIYYCPNKLFIAKRENAKFE